MSEDMVWRLTGTKVLGAWIGGWVLKMFVVEMDLPRADVSLTRHG